MTGDEGVRWGSGQSGDRGLWGSWAVRKEVGLAEGAATLCGPPRHRRVVFCVCRAPVSSSRRPQRRHLQCGAACLQRDHICGLRSGQAPSHILVVCGYSQHRLLVSPLPVGVKCRSSTFLYPPLLIIVLNISLHTFRSIPAHIIFVSTIKRHLENSRNFQNCVLDISTLSIVLFLLDVPSALLLFYFCLEKFLQPFLLGRSAGDKFSSSLLRRSGCPLRSRRMFLLDIEFWVDDSFYSSLKNVLLLPPQLQVSDEKNCSYWYLFSPKGKENFFLTAFKTSLAS